MRKHNRRSKYRSWQIEVLESRLLLRATISDGNAFSHGSVYDYAPTAVYNGGSDVRLWWGTQNGTDPNRYDDQDQSSWYNPTTSAYTHTSSHSHSITGDQIWTGTKEIAGGVMTAGSTLITRLGPVNGSFSGGASTWTVVNDGGAWYGPSGTPQAGWASWHINDPTVIHFGGQYVMYFDGSNNDIPPINPITQQPQPDSGISKNLLGRATWDGDPNHGWVAQPSPVAKTTGTLRAKPDSQYASEHAQYSRYGIGNPSAVAKHVDSNGAIDSQTGVTVAFYNEMYNPANGFVLRSNYYMTSTDGITFSEPVRLTNIPSKAFTNSDNYQIPVINGVSNVVYVDTQYIDDIAWTDETNSDGGAGFWYITTSETEHNTGSQYGSWSQQIPDTQNKVVHVYKTRNAQIGSPLIQIGVVDEKSTLNAWNFSSAWARETTGKIHKEADTAYTDTIYDDNKYLYFGSGSSSAGSWELHQARIGSNVTITPFDWVRSPSSNNPPNLDVYTTALGERTKLVNTFGYSSQATPYFYALNGPYYYHTSNPAGGATEYPNGSATFYVGGTNYSILPVYRLYNPNVNGMHFYTTSETEKSNCLGAGWVFECIEGYQFSNPSSKPSAAVAIKRYYKASNGNHRYAIEGSAQDALGSGETLELTAWYAYTSDPGRTVAPAVKGAVAGPAVMMTASSETVPNEESPNPIAIAPMEALALPLDISSWIPTAGDLSMRRRSILGVKDDPNMKPIDDVFASLADDHLGLMDSLGD